MSLPRVTQFVDYRLTGRDAGKTRLGLVTSVVACPSLKNAQHGDEIVDLQVFGEPGDMKPGLHVVKNVKRSQHEGPPGTWTART